MPKYRTGAITAGFGGRSPRKLNSAKGLQIEQRAEAQPITFGGSPDTGFPPSGAATFSPVRPSSAFFSS
jgi:hypothetical protein